MMNPQQARPAGTAEPYWRSNEEAIRDAVAFQMLLAAEDIRDGLERPAERPRGIFAEDLVDQAARLAELAGVYVACDKALAEREQAQVQAADEKSGPVGTCWRRLVRGRGEARCRVFGGGGERRR